MEHSLLCNNLRCRSELADQALVTTCSHIFCLGCARKLGLIGQAGTNRSSCPACDAQLGHQDDAIVIGLNPSENYKTSVLSGLSPNVIIECAGRALSFWTYQTSQDMYYQQYLCRTLGEKCSGLSLRLERTLSDANSEIEELKRTVTNLSAEHDTLRRKNEDLAGTCREKSRKLLQTRELYDKVKRKAEMGQLQRAASDAVDSRLMGMPEGGQAVIPGLRLGEEEGPSQRTNAANVGASVPRTYPRSLNETSRWTSLGHSTEQRGSAGAPFAARPPHGPSSPFGGHPGFQGRFDGFSGLSPQANRQTMPAPIPDMRQGRGRLAGIGLTNGLRVSQPTHLPAMSVPVPPPGICR